MAQPLAKANGDQFAPRPSESVGGAGKFERHGDIFEGRHVGNEMEGLEHDADRTAPHRRQRIFRKIVQRLVGNMNLARIQPFEAGNHHQKRRFARSRRTDDTDRFTATDLQIDSLEHMHGGGAIAER